MSDTYSMVPTSMNMQAELKARLEALTPESQVYAVGQDWILFIDKYTEDNVLNVELVQFWSGMSEVVVLVPVGQQQVLNNLLYKNPSFKALCFEFQQLGWLQEQES